MNNYIFLLLFFTYSATGMASSTPLCTVTLPLLGTFNLQVETDPLTNKAFFKGTLASAKEVTFGPVTIGTGDITLIDDQLSINASVQIFKQKATLSVQNVAPATKTSATARTYPTINFSLTFDQKPLFENAQLIFSLEGGHLTIDQLDGLSFTVQARLKEVDGGSALITLTGTPASTALTGHFEKPFSFTPIFNEPDVTITGKDVTLIYQSNSISLLIEGAASIFNHALQAQVQLTKSSNQTSAVVKAFINQPIALSQLVPKLKKSVADELILSSGTVYASTIAYTDPANDIAIKPGLTLYAQLDMAKSPTLTPLVSIAHTKTITVTGTLSHNTNDISLVAKLPTIIIKDPHIKELALFLIITGEPSVEVSGEIAFIPEADQKPLTGHINASFESSSLVLHGGLTGCWEHPFAIAGARLCDPSLIIGIEPKTFLATGIPSKLGFSAAFEVAQRIVRMAAVFDAQDNSKMVLLGDLEGTISLQDLVLLALSLGPQDSSTKKIRAQKIQNALPPIAIKDMLFKMAPATMTINDKTYYRGFTAQGTVELLKQKLSMGFNLGYDGIYAHGYISTLKLGPLLITGPGPDNITGTEDDGAQVSIYATLDKQECVVQGQAKFDTLFDSQSDIHISPLSGITFFTSAKLFEVFSATIDAKSIGSLENPDFIAKVEFSNELPLMLQNAIENDLADLQVRLAKAAVHANEQLEQERKKIKERQLKTANDITKSKEELLEKVDTLKKSINSMQGELAHLEQVTVNAKNQLETMPFTIKSIGLAADIIGYEIARAAKMVELELVQSTLQSTQELIEGGASATAAITGKQLTLTEQAIEKQLKPLITGLLKQIGYLSYTGTTFIANNIINALVLTKVTYTGSLSALAKGQLVNLTLELKLLGQPKKYDIPFNFANVKTSTQKAADKVTQDALKIKGLK